MAGSFLDLVSEDECWFTGIGLSFARLQNGTIAHMAMMTEFLI